MRHDYKYAIQMRAEELADRMFQRDYFKLSSATQDRLYEHADEEYRESRLEAHYDRLAEDAE